jgi:thiamine pyrophosphate-dependent acetolactate synthase large subunit-like protein
LLTEEDPMTEQEAHAANMKRAHKALVEAKNCLYAAAEQCKGAEAHGEVRDIAGAVRLAINATHTARFG